MGSTPTITEQDQAQASTESQDEKESVEQETNDGTRAQLEDPDVQDPIAEDKALQTALVKLCQHFGQLEKYARRTEVMDARRQRFYRRGDQYIVWNTANYMFGNWPAGAMDIAGGASPGQDTPRYTDVYNIFWPYLRIIISVGVQNPPGVNFEPDDPTKATDISRARAAEKYRHRVDRVNKRKALQSRVMSLFGTDGRTILYTRPIRDAQNYGVDDDNKPKTVELIEAFGVLEAKVVPIVANEQSQLIAVFLSDEPEINIAKQTYPDHASEIKEGQSGTGESAYERNARIGVLQGTRLLQQAGDAYAHLTTRHRVFLRPAAFEHAPDEVKQKLKEAFPKGAKVWICGDAYCRSAEILMDSQIAIGFPAPGDGMNRPSMMKDMVAVQDAFNDYKNLEKEYADWGIPTTYRLTETGDIESLREQSAEPGNQQTMELPSGIATLADCFFVEPTPNCPIEIIQAYKDLRDALAQFIVGTPPALFGGSDEHNETKGGIAMLRDQAMGQFSICWGLLQELFATAYKQAVEAAAQSIADDAKINLRIPGRNGRSLVSSISGSDLKNGNFHAFPDTDSSFPETSGSRRQTIQMLWTNAAADPAAAQALGLTEPDNLELTRETLGITDWVIPGANSRDKQMGEIELLLEQSPALPSLDALKAFEAQQLVMKAAAAKLNQPPPPDPEMVPIPMPGAPGPDGNPVPQITPVPRSMLKSTIPVNKRDFHNFELETIKDWLSEPDGIEARRTNPLGVLNVELHADEHEAMMAKQAPPPMAAPPKRPEKPGAGPQAGAPAIPNIPALAAEAGAGSMNAPIQ
jgi:hypothetical protein